MLYPFDRARCFCVHPTGNKQGQAAPTQPTRPAIQKPFTHLGMWIDGLYMARKTSLSWLASSMCVFMCICFKIMYRVCETRCLLWIFFSLPSIGYLIMQLAVVSWSHLSTSLRHLGIPLAWYASQILEALWPLSKVIYWHYVLKSCIGGVFLLSFQIQCHQAERAEDY